LLAAVQFLTRIPVPRGEYRLEGALVWMPIVGLGLGAILAACDAGLRWLGVPSLLTSALLVVGLLAMTGGLHADGLMDTCDAVFGHATPERRLEIMRDPRVGAFGVMGLASILLLKVTALDALSGERLQLLVVGPTVGRWAIVLLVGLFPYGRASGLGAPLKSAATPRALLLASVLPVVVCAISGPLGAVSACVALLGAYALGRWLVTLLPGLTGDCYGAACELSETLVWLTGAVIVGAH
jgi:adenosylcobinamide-GDP ribazoletransferase